MASFDSTETQLQAKDIVGEQSKLVESEEEQSGSASVCESDGELSSKVDVLKLSIEEECACSKKQLILPSDEIRQDVRQVEVFLHENSTFSVQKDKEGFDENY